MAQGVKVSIFKNQLTRAYEYYPIAEIEKAEWHRKEFTKLIKNMIMESAQGGRSEMTDEFRASWLPLVLEFCKDNDLEVEYEELPTQVNEARFRVRIWGWANEGNERIQASDGGTV